MCTIVNYGHRPSQHVLCTVYVPPNQPLGKYQLAYFVIHSSNFACKLVLSLASSMVVISTPIPYN